MNIKKISTLLIGWSFTIGLCMNSYLNLISNFAFIILLVPNIVGLIFFFILIEPQKQNIKQEVQEKTSKELDDSHISEEDLKFLEEASKSKDPLLV